MKNLLLIPLMLIGACASTHNTTHLAGTATLQDEGEQGGMMAMTPEQMMAMMQFMAPGDVHTDIAKMAGDWTVSAKMWEGPGTEAMMMDYEVSGQMILGGRYLQEDSTGSFMGQEFKGFMLFGYNNGTEEYFSIWLDNFGTGMALSKGKANREGKVEMTGTMEDWMAPAGRPFRSVMESQGKDAHTLHMWGIDENGAEFKTMELAYTRKQREVKTGGR